MGERTTNCEGYSTSIRKITVYYIFNRTVPKGQNAQYTVYAEGPDGQHCSIQNFM